MKVFGGTGHQVDSRRAHGLNERMDVEALFRAHAGFVAAFLGRLGVPQADVDDRVQEVFLVAHRKGGYTPGQGHPRTWLGAIAVRVASTARRSVARRREDGSDALLARIAPQASPAEVVEQRRALDRVPHALDSLDREHRSVFVLYEIDGQPCEAIAESFGIPVGTVYSRLHNARRRFKQLYAELSPDDDRALLGTHAAEGT